RSHLPNVFISRENRAGEAAMYGPGFYTRVGRMGAVGSGFHIRFAVAPDAVEGTDFALVPGNDYVRFFTRDALTVLPESLEPDPVAALSFLLAKENLEEKGIAGMLLRRLRRVFSDEKA